VQAMADDEDGDMSIERQEECKAIANYLREAMNKVPVRANVCRAD
jgi:hypothetical protein